MHAKFVTLPGLLAATLFFLAACSSTPETPPPGPPPGAGGPGGPGGPGGVGMGAAVPGSQQDLAQSAGDRVFFEFDRSDITPEAQQTLQRQAQWLQHYPNVTVTDRGALRRARHPRIQPCSWRTPRQRRQTGLGRRRHSVVAGFDDQLRQGSPGGPRLDRRSLGSESCRDHHSELIRREPVGGWREQSCCSNLSKGSGARGGV